jgi:tryptophan-rich sensory protein
MNTYFSLALSILLSLAAGAIGSVFTYSEIPTWYASLVRPDIAPPNWVFGPVWTTLYILMGTAAWLVYTREKDAVRRRESLALYVLQLALNTLWSIIFFSLHALGLALAEVVLLWIAIVATLWAFARTSRIAALLLVPYLAWVSFAGYLTYSFWLLN